MKLLELTLLEVDYLKKVNDHYQIYLSGKIFKGKPIEKWCLYDNNGALIKQDYYDNLFNKNGE